ncbi:hypothetical protein FOYG_15088 [Fusarium oxysporum NRRL 32931]|uniref:Uncharacterized protein n=1 Tax=Fusarium oxysporum NRRL 32931 TaxID=660029 RepID=W9HL62_FUSOX|nr:hypothetical protein FOYG_15088 [Fusarium oxysporum NRRL 32931]
MPDLEMTLDTVIEVTFPEPEASPAIADSEAMTPLTAPRSAPKPPSISLLASPIQIKPTRSIVASSPISSSEKRHRSIFWSHGSTIQAKDGTCRGSSMSKKLMSPSF